MTVASAATSENSPSSTTSDMRRRCLLMRCVLTVALLGVIQIFAKPALAAEMLDSSSVYVVKAIATPVGDNNIHHPQRAMISSIDAMWRWIMMQQANLNRALTAAVRGLKQQPAQGSILLVAIAFAYGVLHAAGPGHGKAVIASYVLANGTTVRRGVALSFLAAAFQALAALALVGVLVLLMGQSARSALSLERWLEVASWGLIVLVGAWLLWRQLAPMLGHSTRKEHGDDCTCCERHLPPAQILNGEWSWPRAVAIAISVGIRPCTGAILLLAFAIGQGLFWAGVLGTLAMAFGTALTVSALALMAVYARHWSIALWGQGSRLGGCVARASTVLAAVLVIAIGAAGMHAALTAPRIPDFMLGPRS